MDRPMTQLVIILTAIALLASARVCRGAQTEPGSARGDDGVQFIAQLGSTVSILGELISRDGMPGSFAYNLKVGLRKKRWDFFVQAEHGFWRDDEGVDDLSIQTMNVGIGAGLLYFDRHMRASLAAGASILLTPSQLDDPGSVGAFVDLRPAGFRWPLGERAVVELHPLTFAIVMPTTSGIPLLYFTYRTALLIELRF